MNRKLLFLFQPACICVLIACAMQDNNKWRSEVAGSHVAQYEQPYSIGFDTLVVEKIKNDYNSFFIKRRTGYQRKDSIKAGENIYKKENWVGTADRTYPMLHIMPSGRELWFNPSTGELTAGTTIYHRL